MTESTLAVVTGGAGFVGSHLCERLVQEGYQVISLDNYFTGTPENHVAGVEYRTGHTKDIVKHIAESPAVVFHLGEYARTEKSFEDVEVVWDLNKTGTFSVLEFCRRKKSKLVYAGSSTKFADGGDGRNQSPYAWTKATNTELVKNYADWFGIEYAIAYFYNVYGPREMSGAFGTLISIFTELKKHGQPFTVTAPGTQTRNYTHVNDIVDGLLLVAKHGRGDGYGIGADQQYSVLEVAEMFKGDVIMMPERKGNRLNAGVDNEQVKALGWTQKNQLVAWITGVLSDIGETKTVKNNILVFSTTYLPHAGPAELALYDLCKALPDVHFDIVTTKFSKSIESAGDDLPNIKIHRVGRGYPSDKFLLPIMGARKARELRLNKEYLFQWSLFASYASLASFLSRRKKDLPLLITLADQKLGKASLPLRFIVKFILGRADQIYAIDTYETKTALAISKRSSLVTSIGAGDAFANQIRITYTNLLKARLKE